MKTAVQLAIEGYNKEKSILSDRLGQLPTDSKSIMARSSIKSRLREIDEALSKTLNLE